MFFILFFSCSSIPKGSSNQPDIILVSIDTLRADHVSSYGYHRQTTPFIDQLSSRGTRFSHAWSTSSWTLPAHTSLLSGTRSLQHKVIEERISIPTTLPLISETLHNAGWYTGGVVSASFVSRLYGFERGFDYFEDFGLNGDDKQNLHAEIQAEDIVNTALTWLQKGNLEEGKPVFLFLHFYDAHYECNPPKPFDTEFDQKIWDSETDYQNYFYYQKNPLSSKELEHQIAQYDEAILYTDTQLQRLYTIWEKSERDAIWIITSDHGEEFGERGSWGHAHTLYKEQIHIPLIISPTPKKQVRKEYVGIDDIASTIGRLAGVAFEGSGISLLDEIIPQRDFYFETSRFHSNRLSIFSDGYRLEWDIPTDTTELFHQEIDLQEQNPLNEEQRVVDMKQKILTYVGTNWSVRQSGYVFTKKGYFFDGIQPTQDLSLKSGDSFQVLPFDSNIRFKKNLEILNNHQHTI